MIDCKTVSFFALDNLGEHQAKTCGLGRVSNSCNWPVAWHLVSPDCARSLGAHSLDYPSTKKRTVLQSKSVRNMFYCSKFIYI